MTNERIDVAGDVRDGEALDIDAVDAWLKPRIEGLNGRPEVTQYSGGASNWTYRLAYPSHDLILRRPPAGTKAASAHDMSREYRVQAGLHPVYPYVPKMMALCEDEAVIGCPFYVMRRIEGIIPRAGMPRGLPFSAEQARALCHSAIDKLIALHSVDVDQAGLRDLGKGAGYVQRQIEGWTERYASARTWNVPRFQYVSRWLEANRPMDVATCVIHNDFRLDNCVLNAEDPTRVIGILDWEMATLGDPLMDLGNTLAYWIQADDDRIARATRRQPTHLPGMMTREEIVAYYCERTGWKPDNWPFYEVYGLFRLAVIGQQIYYRYHHRQTRNPAFRNIWILVHYLYWRCRGVIRRAT
ncbi:phosphotransferase family protein [Algiphilus sp.]|uniref:phosphotransferase family protein n=1 Tax=Algiphilus sp. TaxID=1872431 RepID=UPI003B52E4FC